MRTLLTPGFGLTTPATFMTLPDQATDLKTPEPTSLFKTLRTQRYRPHDPSPWLAFDSTGKATGKSLLAFWLLGKLRQDSRTPKDVSAALLAGQLLGLAIASATATSGGQDLNSPDGFHTHHLT
jgi:hypothetical protein